MVVEDDWILKLLVDSQLFVHLYLILAFFFGKFIIGPPITGSDSASLVLCHNCFLTARIESYRCSGSHCWGEGLPFRRLFLVAYLGGNMMVDTSIISLHPFNDVSSLLSSLHQCLSHACFEASFFYVYCVHSHAGLTSLACWKMLPISFLSALSPPRIDGDAECLDWRCRSCFCDVATISTKSVLLSRSFGERHF